MTNLKVYQQLLKRTAPCVHKNAYFLNILQGGTVCRDMYFVFDRRIGTKSVCMPRDKRLIENFVFLACKTEKEGAA